LAGVFVEDRENVILFATISEAAEEDYVDRKATDIEDPHTAVSGMLSPLGDERHTSFGPEETEEKPRRFPLGP
jgi:hypothetical protein